MNANENLVKKQKVEDSDYEEIEEIEEDEEKEKKSKSSDSYQDSAKKKMIKMMGFIIGGAIIFIFIL